MIITVEHTKGGVGKSLIAWNLAIQMKAKKILDIDVQKTLVFTNFLRKQNNIEPLDIITVDSKDKLLSELNDVQPADLVVIDVGGYDNDLTRAALVVADFVLTPASDRISETAGLMHFEQILKDVSHDIGEEIVAHILINNVNPNAKNFDVLKSFASEKSNFKLLETIVYQRADLYKAMEMGQGVMEIVKNGKASKEISNLAKEIKSRMINES